jgi:hypothetical protein
MTTKIKITIRPVEGTTALHHRYPRETKAQRCHVELDCRTGDLTACYDPETGGAYPFAVHHGHVLRWRVPCLRADAANALLVDLEVLAQRIVDGYSSRWDGNNNVGSLNDDAHEAREAIEQEVDRLDACSDDVVKVWEACAWFAPLGSRTVQARELGITVGSTDEELQAIATRETANATDVDELEGVDAYLEGLRAHVRELATP